MQILIATSNLGKTKEFKDILKEVNIEVLSLNDIEYNKEIIEDGMTFEDNALIKARQISLELNIPVIADDSGLCVYALGLQPGVYSARYSGLGDLENNKLLLKNMENITDRRAYFYCALCLFFPNGDYRFYTGKLDGKIAYEIKGENGFGYDSVFYMDEYLCNIAQMPIELKNEISHRAIAIKKLMKDIYENFNIK